MKRAIFALCIVVILAAATVSGAHQDPNADGARCDTWSRTGHTHDHTDNSDTSVPGDPTATALHSHGGHHMLRNRAGYLEVVGGQSYRGPDPSGKTFPGQGGFVQGEIDVVQGAPDADFNVAFFGPNADELPAPNAGAVLAWVNGSYGKVCVNVAGQQVSQQSRQP